MDLSRCARCGASLGLWLAIAVTAEAQPGGTFGEVEFVGAQPVRVVSGSGAIEVRIGRRSSRVFRGRDLQMWSGANERGVLVAALTGSGVEAAFVPVADGVPAQPQVSRIRRLAPDGWAPVGAAVAVRPDGFAVFWQEANMQSPGQLYRTFTMRFDERGRPTGETGEVRARWPMADIAYEPSSDRYYMLLYFGSPAGTRLCGVHVHGQTLTSIEHPFWVSDVDRIEDARLVRSGERMFALYLAGENVDRVFAADVTTGQWGQYTGRPTAREAVRRGHAFGGRAESDGVEVVWAAF